MDRIDLDELERVADCYEARKNSLIESGIRRDQAYLATFAQGDSVKAFEALRPLIARVRELERQRKLMAGKIGTLTRWYDAMAGCEVCEFTQDCDNSEACCVNAIIQWAEKAAKEAGE